jgi:hypothetical protein
MRTEAVVFRFVVISQLKQWRTVTKIFVKVSVITAKIRRRYLSQTSLSLRQFLTSVMLSFGSYKLLRAAQLRIPFFWDMTLRP